MSLSVKNGRLMHSPSARFTNITQYHIAMSTKKGSKVVNQHKFTNVRETLVTDTSSKNPISVTTDASGNKTISVILSPLGLTACVLGSGTFGAGTAGNVDQPHLLWMNAQASGFDYYRVTNPRLLLVGSQGSTVTGIVNVFTSKDVTDVMTGALQTAFVGSSGKSIDLASLANRIATVPMSCDTSWKKVSTYLNVPGSAVGLKGSTTMLVNTNSINDLCFTSFMVQVVGAAANSATFTLQLLYDVEFKDPVNPALNV